ncbi:homoprotocatechuate degradation operon regulator HpaR [Xanthobacter sp. DSM 24535]|uniref:homoprotocatechuate degradation operon regulator HpaR n=1 Tax=Roseixanthobacter psychrophilus TaxID=3119917 RepID=UPI0037287D34
MSLLRAREAVMVHFRPHLHGVNLTEQQWRVLRALMGTGSMEVQALVDAAFLLGPSLSRILKDLEARGFVLRRVSEKDMRRGHISISQSGRQLVEESGVQSEAIYAEITHRYGADKLARLQAMLRDLESVLAAPLFDASKPDEAGRQSAKPRAKEG